jgi:hypothetical protein
MGNGEEVVVMTYGTDSCVHVEVHVCVCVYKNTYTFIQL